MIQLLLTVFLAFHTIVQPYRIAWHNVLDGGIFMILACLDILQLKACHSMALYFTISLLRKARYYVKWCQEKVKKLQSKKKTLTYFVHYQRMREEMTSFVMIIIIDV